MSDALAGLSPRSLWGHFSALAAIPRPSKQEERAVAWVRAIADKHGFAVRADAVGNLVVDVPASRGHERAPTVVLQSHLDMVCEKNRDVDHDFDNDPIRPRIDGEWVYATGTTLGADNGIGVAAALAAATDAEVVHGPLELLFTLDEETGLTGAKGLDPSLVRGRILLNMDSEEDGVLFVGCAGGSDSHLYLSPERSAPAGEGVTLRVEVGGLRGGHSGIDIHENRGNAVKLLTRALTAAVEAGVEVELASLCGGSKHNAIPREAEATVRVPPADEGRFGEIVASMLEEFRVELAGIDEGLEIAVRPAAEGQAGARFLGRHDRDRLLGLLSVLSHGVLAMSRDIPGLVESSQNVAVVEEAGERIRLVVSGRSSIDPTMRALSASVRAAGRLAGAEVESHDGYPGWKPDLASGALAVLREVYEKLWTEEPRVTAVHAGLECGLLGEKIDGIDMISFGPQIEGAHSPDERVSIPSVARFWEALRLALARFAERG